MPPRPIVSLKILLMFKIVLFVFSDPLFVTSYTCNITSVILPLFLTNPIQSNPKTLTLLSPKSHTEKLSVTLSLSRSYSLPRSTASIQFCPSLPLSRCVYEEFGIFRFWPRSAKKLLFFIWREMKEEEFDYGNLRNCA